MLFGDVNGRTLEDFFKELTDPAAGEQVLQLEMYIVFVARAFTVLELRLKYSLLAIALLVLGLWSHRLRALHGRYSRE